MRTAIMAAWTLFAVVVTGTVVSLFVLDWLLWR
jgi:hypothetical protein